MPELVAKAWRCAYCPKRSRRIYFTLAGVKRHERHCTNNPNRMALTGEVFDEYNNYFVDHSPYRAPEMHMIWDGIEWQPIPYSQHKIWLVPIRYRLERLEQTCGIHWARDEAIRRELSMRPCQRALPAPPQLVAITYITSPCRVEHGDNFKGGTYV
jgi:hypothetical protein